MRVTVPQLLRIVITGVMLIAVVVMTKPCADATGRFVAGFDPPDAAPPVKPLPPGSVHLTPEMSDAERAAAIAKARAAVMPDAGAGDAGVAPDAGAVPATDAGAVPATGSAAPR